MFLFLILLQSNNFQKIGDVPATGNNTNQQQYSFIDRENFKSGTRYYRIKTVNQDGSYSYSVIRSVVFDIITAWQIAPNPSAGLFYLIYNANNGEEINIQLSDAIGKVLKVYTIKGSGFVQKLPIDLSTNNYPAGIYILQTQRNEATQTFKLHKR